VLSRTPPRSPGCDLRQGSSYYARDGVKGVTITKATPYLGGKLQLQLSDNTRPLKSWSSQLKEGLLLLLQLPIATANPQSSTLRRPLSLPAPWIESANPLVLLLLWLLLLLPDTQHSTGTSEGAQVLGPYFDNSAKDGIELHLLRPALYILPRYYTVLVWPPVRAPV